jgi:glycine/D-amino acid oxidase-like deaminating enzyme
MRLTSAAIRPAGRPITLRFDGVAIPAIEGETVAAALSAAGIVAFRRTPSGAPRGLHCGMGACFDCVVTIDGRIGQRACLAKAADGMCVTADMPAAPAPLAESPDGAIPDRACDVLVVGGGPAGLAAAVAAAEAGAAVVLLDERERPGGQYLKPLATSHRDSRPDAQARAGDAWRARAAAAGVELLGEALVWGAFAADEIAAVVAGRAVTFRPRRLILAAGAHERPVPLPGWTLPGVMTTGAMQTLARAQRVSPGARVLVAGNGPLNLQLACELVAGGATVAAVVEAAPRPGAAAIADAVRLLRAAPDLAGAGVAYLAKLRRAGVPLLWGSRVTALHGADRVQAAEIATPDGPCRIEADVVALNLGFQPETGLARALGIPHRFVDTGIGHLATEADTDGRTALAGVFAVGDGAALGGARVALARGRLAGLAAARDLGHAAPDEPATRVALARAEAFQTALRRLFAAPPHDAELADTTIVCRCEEITAGRLRAELAGGLASLAALKKATRAGMGRCQGRFCAATIARLCPQAPDAMAFAAPRAPVRPAPAAALMQEAGEFTAPLLDDPPPPAHRLPVAGQPAVARDCDILVIGGGILGLSCAYYLARDGADVLLAERDEAAMAASTANAGSLHVQLLSYDFDDTTTSDSPAIATLPLAVRSVELWREIAAAAGEGLGLSTQGGLMVAETAADMAWLRAKAAMEARAGIETYVIGANELRAMAPAMSPRLQGAVYCPAEGYGDPLRGSAALRRLAAGHDARLLTGAEVQAITRDGAGWRVRTSLGEIRAGRVVNAAGPWADRIAAMVGLRLPVTGTVQQVIVTEPAPPLMTHLVAMARRHLSLKQQANGSLLIGGGWFGAFDRDTGRTRALRENIQANLWVTDRVLPAVRGLSIIRCWTGINSAIDRAPILGEAPGLPGFFNAVTANGYTLGPVCGELTAAALRHATPPSPGLTLARFREPA